MIDFAKIIEELDGESKSPLSARIMNLSASQKWTENGFAEGHKEARHAAAEVALDAERCIEQLTDTLLLCKQYRQADSENHTNSKSAV